MYQKCEYCSKSFEAERVTARFCSTKCRVKFNRELKRNQKIMNAAGNKGEALAMFMDESDKISHSLRQLLEELKVNRSKRLWERIEELHKENTRLIAKIADLVAN